MIKISESEIENYLQEFNKRDIILNIKGLVIANIKMVLASCVYNRDVGILEISNYQAKFEFNMTDLYKMSISVSGKILQMYFDHGILVTIEK